MSTIESDTNAFHELKKWIKEFEEFLEKPNSSLSDAVEQFLGLLHRIKIEPIFSQVRGTVDVLIKGMLKDIYIFVNYFNYIHKGKAWEAIGYDVGRMMTNFLSKQMPHDLDEFSMSSDYTSNPPKRHFRGFLFKGLPPIDFWKHAIHFYPLLSELGISLLNIPACFPSFKKDKFLNQPKNVAIDDPDFYKLVCFLRLKHYN